jgi:hypothetical protein
LNRPSSPLSPSARRAYSIGAAVVALAFTVVAAGTLRNELDGGHRFNDGAGARFQAEVVAIGRLAVPAPPVPEPFRVSLTLVRDGKWFAQYYPGFPAILAPFVRLDLDWLANPLLGGLLVFGTFLLGRRLFDAETAFLAALLVATSPLTMTLTTTFLSHVACSALLVFAGYLVVRARESRSLAVGLLAGFLFGWAVAARPYTALLCALPLALVLGHDLLRNPRTGFRIAAAFAAGALPWAIALPAWNALLVGSPWSSAYDLQWPHHRLGFHAIPARERFLPDRVVDRYDPEIAWIMLLRQFASARDMLLPFAYGASVIALPLLLFRGLNRRDALLLTAPLALVAGYFFYPGTMGISSTILGPRYYSEALPALLLVVAHAVVVGGRRLGRPGAASILVLAAVLTLFGFRDARDRARKLDRRSFGPAAVANRSVERWLTTLDSTPRVIFVDISTMHRDSALLTNRPDLTGPNLVAVYEEPETNRAVLDAFPGRTAALVRWTSGGPDLVDYSPELDTEGPPNVYPYTRARRRGVFEGDE